MTKHYGKLKEVRRMNMGWIVAAFLIGCIVGIVFTCSLPGFAFVREASGTLHVDYKDTIYILNPVKPVKDAVPESEAE